MIDTDDSPQDGTAEPTDATSGEQDSRSLSYWLRWIRSAKKAAERHTRDSKEAYREFEKDFDTRDDNVPLQQRIVYPFYWSACDTILSAYYARQPKIITAREFEINDDVANTGALIIERLGKYHLRNSHFSETMRAITADFIHAAKTTGQIIYEATTTKAKTRVPVQQAQGAEGIVYVDTSGNVINDEIKQDENGLFAEVEIDQVDEASQRIYTCAVPFDEILHTPTAKASSEIVEIAYFFSLTKDEAAQKFDEEVIRNYPWQRGQPKPSDSMSEGTQDRDETADLFMQGWEIHCKKTRKIYFVSEHYRQGFLKAPIEDPYKLRNFFPSPDFAIANKPRRNLYPRPAYVHLRPTLMQLHLMYQRVFGLIDSVRRRAIVDGDEEIIALLTAGDQEFVSARRLQGIVEKGGLDKMIWYLPVKELVDAIAELNALEDRFKNNAYEWFGVPDILRGQSDPIEALGTQQIKATAAHDRFKIAKMEMQRIARDLIEMMVDLSLQVFSDEKIARICGYNYLSPEDQQRFMPALQFLRDDEERFIRLEIETDSMSFIDEDLKYQRRNMAIQAAVNGVKEVTAMMQQSPSMGALAMKAVLLSLENLEDGKQFSDSIKQITNELNEQAQQPPPEPPPDYEAQKIQIEQQKLALQQQKMQLDANTDQLTLQYKQQIELEKLAAQARQSQLMVEIESLKVQLQGAQIGSDVQIERTKSDVNAFKIQAEASARAQELKLEEITKMLEIKEKFLEEARLKQQELDKRIELIAKPATEAAAKSSSSAPVIHIHNGGEKEFSMKRSPDGSLIGRSRSVKEDA